MGVKSMENRVYSIIIICLLILIALISWERGRSGHYQISSSEGGFFLLDTKTGGTYSFGEGVWIYMGKPKKTIDIELDKGNQK
jgi:hypothetical protein